MGELFSFSCQFVLIYQILLLDFSLKIQLCVCMYMYALFKSVRNVISKHILEEPVVLDKSNILFLQYVEVPRGAQLCPSVLRVPVSFLSTLKEYYCRTIWAQKSVFRAFRKMKAILSPACTFCMCGYVVFQPTIQTQLLECVDVFSDRLVFHYGVQSLNC